MSRYEQCLKFFKTSRFKKDKLSLGAMATLLAIAKESDRLQQNPVEISDERLMELANEEMLFLCTEKCKKIFKMFGEEDISNERIYGFIMYFCTGMNKDIEFLYKEANKLTKTLKKVSPKKRKELIKNFRESLH